MARGISITRDAQLRAFVLNRGDAFRLRVTAHDAETMPVQIFVHEKRLINPYTGDTIDDFTHIASPFDLLLYPVGAPDAAAAPTTFSGHGFLFGLLQEREAAKEPGVVEHHTNSIVADLHFPDWHFLLRAPNNLSPSLRHHTDSDSLADSDSSKSPPHRTVSISLSTSKAFKASTSKQTCS